MQRPSGNGVSRRNSQVSNQPTSPQFHRRLGAYALAASAAGMAMAATAPHHQASSTVVYTPANIHFGTDRLPLPIPVDFDHNGTTDIEFLAYNYAPGYSLQGDLSAFNVPFPNGLLVDQPLRRGAVIGPSAGNFQPGRHVLAGDHLSFGGTTSHRTSRSRSIGAFANVKDAYLGVRFQIDGQIHYGWIRLTVTSHKGVVSGTLTGYAYNTVPNQSLNAGETGTSAAALPPQPATLGMLSLGAPALELWRKK